jgi:chemotaxis protein histidine kinase CheA
MTEFDWFLWDDPTAILRALREPTQSVLRHSDGTKKPLVSERKLRLFACACCRRIWRHLSDIRSRRAVKVSERFADREATKEELEAAHAAAVEAAEEAWEAGAEAAMEAWDYRCDARKDLEAAREAWKAAREYRKATSEYSFAEDAKAEEIAARKTAEEAGKAAEEAGKAEEEAWEAATDNYAEAASAAAFPDAWDAAFAASGWAAGDADRARKAAKATQAALLRDIFVNPWRPVDESAIHPWRTWNDHAAEESANIIYIECVHHGGKLDNTRLLKLADMLVEAGCTDEQILAHLRSSGEHYRGCWVIDLLLGKT